MKTLLKKLRNNLKEHADPQVQQTGKRFFKPEEQIISYGVSTKTLKIISNQFYQQIPNPSKKEIFSLCEQLWQSTLLEESFIACFWSNKVHAQYLPEDMNTFYHWLAQYVNNWASCDTLCNHTIGDFLQMYPEKIHELKNWVKEDNRWVKRGAAVSLVIPARKGLFLDDIFEIAEILLTDTDDLVQKGYGWMLKAASESHPQAIFDYLLTKKKTMRRTAFRYALEKMPEYWRKEAMRKEE